MNNNRFYLEERRLGELEYRDVILVNNKKVIIKIYKKIMESNKIVN